MTSLREIHQRYGNLGQRSAFDPTSPRTLIMDLGSLFSEPPIDEDPYELSRVEELFDWLNGKSQAPWRWMINDRNHYVKDPIGRSEINGVRLTPSDVQRELWLNFDSKGDAMLAKMSFENLRSARDADRRGLPS